MSIELVSFATRDGDFEWDLMGNFMGNFMDIMGYIVGFIDDTAGKPSQNYGSIHHF